nr:MAG TPA: hypothetical protein [Bacteriophage sp.]
MLYFALYSFFCFSNVIILFLYFGLIQGNFRKNRMSFKRKCLLHIDLILI